MELTDLQIVVTGLIEIKANSATLQSWSFGLGEWTYGMAIFVHISNILAVTDPILTKLFGPNFLGILNFFEQIFWPKYFLGQKFFGLEFFWDRVFSTQILWTPNFFLPKILIFLDLHFLT